jgi:hypothetical protein
MALEKAGVEFTNGKKPGVRLRESPYTAKRGFLGIPGISAT